MGRHVYRNHPKLVFQLHPLTTLPQHTPSPHTNLNYFSCKCFLLSPCLAPLFLFSSRRPCTPSVLLAACRRRPTQKFAALSTPFLSSGKRTHHVPTASSHEEVLHHSKLQV